MVTSARCSAIAPVSRTGAAPHVGDDLDVAMDAFSTGAGLNRDPDHALDDGLLGGSGRRCRAGKRTLVGGVAALPGVNVSANTVPGWSTLFGEVRDRHHVDAHSPIATGRLLSDVRSVLAETRGRVRHRGSRLLRGRRGRTGDRRAARRSDVHKRWPTTAAMTGQHRSCAAAGNPAAAPRARGQEDLRVCQRDQTRHVPKPRLVGRPTPRRKRSPHPCRVYPRPAPGARPRPARHRHRSRLRLGGMTRRRAAPGTARWSGTPPRRPLACPVSSSATPRTAARPVNGQRVGRRSYNSVSLGSLASVGVVLGHHRDVVGSPDRRLSERARTESRPPRPAPARQSGAGSKVCTPSAKLCVGDDGQHRQQPIL